MTVTTTRRAARRAAGRPLKSPLAVASGYPAATGTGPDSAAAASPARSELPPRELQLSEFADHLRIINNRDGRPYEESTISTYVYPAKSLDRWMAANGMDEGFTAVDTAMLNRYFRDYYNEHGQGGTNAQQRNLLQLFRFLQSEYGHPHPYTEKLNRYAEVKGKPQTLSGEFIDDLLEVTGAGRARDFESARDHAMIRVLRTEGIRRQELLGMVMHTLPGDIIKNPTFRLVPLKGARAAGEGRLVTLAPDTARPLALYLRVRRQHKLADSDWVWLGTRSRGRFGNTGIRMMLIRRAEEAGYGKARPHQFRHTFSDRRQMGRIASGASFGSSREHALPAAQRAALRRRHPAEPTRACTDLGLHGPSVPEATMMRLMSSDWVHHRCACWHFASSGGTALHRMHHRQGAEPRGPRHSRDDRAGPPRHGDRVTLLARVLASSLRRMHPGSRDGQPGGRAGALAGGWHADASLCRGHARYAARPPADGRVLTWPYRGFHGLSYPATVIIDPGNGRRHPVHAEVFGLVGTLLSTSFAADGSEDDLMRLNGWKTRAMVDRYASDVADQRALEAKRRLADRL